MLEKSTGASQANVCKNVCEFLGANEMNAYALIQFFEASRRVFTLLYRVPNFRMHQTRHFFVSSWPSFDYLVRIRPRRRRFHTQCACKRLYVGRSFVAQDPKRGLQVGGYVARGRRISIQALLFDEQFDAAISRASRASSFVEHGGERGRPPIRVVKMAHEHSIFFRVQRRPRAGFDQNHLRNREGKK